PGSTSITYRAGAAIAISWWQRRPAESHQPYRHRERSRPARSSAERHHKDINTCPHWRPQSPSDHRGIAPVAPAGAHQAPYLVTPNGVVCHRFWRRLSPLSERSLDKPDIAGISRRRVGELPLDFPPSQPKLSA